MEHTFTTTGSHHSPANAMEHSITTGPHHSPANTMEHSITTGPHHSPANAMEHSITTGSHHSPANAMKHTIRTTGPTEKVYPITLRPFELLGSIISYMKERDSEISVTVPKITTLKNVLRTIDAALPETDETVWIVHWPEALRLKHREMALANVAAWKAEEAEKAKAAEKGAPGVAANNVLSSSYGLPIRAKYDIASLPFPKPLSQESRQRLKENAKPLDDSRQPYAVTLAARITEGTLPVVKGKIILRAINDVNLNEPPTEKIESLDMLWDTGAHRTIISEELLSESFRRSLEDPIYDIYRSASGLRLQMDAVISLSNAAVEIHGIVLVVPKTVVPNERVGVIFGQSECINRMHYESVPRSILMKEAVNKEEKIEETIWGDIIIHKMLNQDDELICL
ncbi:hypothetical protein B7494_g6804 [Chlorociboria aeruginascens]|nr:hypothetical protein B7494_g6804 [Chlorociboria aeruginascens]